MIQLQNGITVGVGIQIGPVSATPILFVEQDGATIFVAEPGQSPIQPMAFAEENT